MATNLTSPPGENPAQESPGGNPVGLAGIFLLLGYALLFTLLVLYSMVKIWPPIPEKEKPGNNNNSSVNTPLGEHANANGNQNSNANANSTRSSNGNGNGNSNVTGGGNANSGGNTNVNGNGNTNAGGGSTNQNPPDNNNTNTKTNTNANANANTNTNSNVSGNANANVSPGGAVPRSEICRDNNGNPREGMAPVNFFWTGDTCIYDEDRLLLIVILAGALGALVHVIRSLSWYIGQRKLYKSWMANYFLLPFLGATTAIVFYLVVRGGFSSATVHVADTNPFGFAVLAALIGMFTDQALQRLKTVAENILMPAPAGRDSAPPAASLSVTAINPRSGPSAGGTTVAITGTGFVAGARVTFGGEPATSVTVTSSATINAVTPAHPAASVDVEVFNPSNQRAVLGNGYTYQ